MKQEPISRMIGVLFFISLALWAYRLIGHFPAFADTLEYVFPEKWFNVESFRKGSLPLWNPYLACGQPHLANFQSAVFYPPFWIWALTGLADWFFFIPLAHSLWGCLGFYLWMRENQNSSLVSALCAVSYGASAMAVLYWGFPTHMAAYSWVPWVFWAVLKYMRRPQFSHWIGVSLCWSFQLLSGYPYFTLYTTLFIGFWLVGKQTDWKRILFLGGALGVALGLTSAQWLPFFDFLGYLHREGWQDPVYCLRWVNLLTLFSPNILGVPGTQGYWGDYPNFIFGNLYLGLIPLGIFILGFWKLKKEYSRYWHIATLAVMIWMAGVYFPPWKLLPEKILETLEPTKAAFLFLFCAITAVGTTMDAWVGWGGPEGISQIKGSTVRQGQLRKVSRGGFPGHSNLLMWGITIFWLVDVFLNPFRVLHLVTDPYRNPKVIQVAQGIKSLAGEGRIISLRNKENIYSTNVHNFESSFFETSMTFRPNTQVIWGIPSAMGYLSIYLDGYQNFGNYIEKGFPYDGRVLDAAGAKLLILPDKLPAFKYKMTFPQGPVFDIQNAGAMPRGWVAEQVREFPNRASVFESLLDPMAFLENQVFTEKSPDGRAVRLPPALRNLEEESHSTLWDQTRGWLVAKTGNWFDLKPDLQISKSRPCEAVFEIMTAHPGYILFDESFAPGWRAWLDGKPETIFRADGYWMAALVPEAGNHKILFRYEPVAVRLGLFLSLIFGMAMAGGIAVGKIAADFPEAGKELGMKTRINRRKRYSRNLSRKSQIEIRFFKG